MYEFVICYASVSRGRPRLSISNQCQPRQNFHLVQALNGLQVVQELHAKTHVFKLLLLTKAMLPLAQVIHRIPSRA